MKSMHFVFCLWIAPFTKTPVVRQPLLESPVMDRPVFSSHYYDIECMRAINLGRPEADIR